MAKKNKSYTEQQLKDMLWKMFLETTLENGDQVDEHPDYNKWETEFLKVQGNVRLKVDGFEASPTDITKILDEVEGSCLTKSCKDTLTKALKGARNQL